MSFIENVISIDWKKHRFSNDGSQDLFASLMRFKEKHDFASEFPLKRQFIGIIDFWRKLRDPEGLVITRIIECDTRNIKGAFDEFLKLLKIKVVYEVDFKGSSEI
ncbi:hypothetical protein ACOME3_007164 [Neoechinorhynchus agilis]